MISVEGSSLWLPIWVSASFGRRLSVNSILLGAGLSPWAQAALASPDDRDVPSVGRLAAMDGSAIAEVAIFEAVGVQPRRLDPADARCGEASGDICLEVEVRLVCRPFDQEALVFCVV